MTRARALLAFLALLTAVGGAVAGCAGPRVHGGSANWREQGLASWYGADFHGRRTANGERYNMYAMTAAHKTLPLGTHIVVIHQGTGRRIRVRVNDRGPFVPGRIVDLSLAAARALGSAGAGVVPVTIEAFLPASAFATANAVSTPAEKGTDLFSAKENKSVPFSTPPAPLRGSFAIQVGAFAVESNARGFAKRLPVPPGAARVLLSEDNRGTLWRVHVGGYESESAAATAADALEKDGIPGFVVRED